MNILNKLLNKKKTEEVALVAENPNEKKFEEGLVSVKDVIAPASLEVDTDFIRIGNKFYRTVFTIINRRFVEINWLSTLINFDASQTVSIYIYPTDGKEILDDLRRKITEMEAEITSDIQRGRVVNPATQAKLEDALNLQTDLVKGEERFFQMGLYITINADSKEDLDKTTKNLEAAMGALMVMTKKTTFQSEESFITTLPLGCDKLSINRNMDTTSLATTFPFVSSDLSDDRGVMFGINEHNGSLVIFDRFSMPNYNSVVFATAGAGKSYMIKLEVLRSLMLGTDIIVIDPENEYKELCEAAGGQYIAFGYSEESKINPFDLALEGDDGENALNSKVLNLHKLFKIMIGNLDPIEESILDKAIMDAYRMKGITPDVETQKKEAPLIEDLYKSLIGMEEEKAKGLAARFEKYIKGSFAGIFNQKTTVNLKSNFVVYGVRNLEESLRPVAMQIILDHIWTVVKKDLRKRILVVDEAWYLMQHEDSASFLRGIVKRGRKYYLGVTTITQDVDDFLATPYGKEIVTNSSIQILLKQHSAAIDQVGQVFYLSEGEKQLLLSADKGEGIFFAGQNHVAIKVVASEDEHRLITSNPEEVMKIKQQKLKLAEERLETSLPAINSLPKVEEEEKDVIGNTIKDKSNTISDIRYTENKDVIGNSIKDKSNTISDIRYTENKDVISNSINDIGNLNPSVSDKSETPPLDPPQAGRQGGTTKEERVMFKAEVAVADDLKQKIETMEKEEQLKIEEHRKVLAEEEAKKKVEEAKIKEEFSSLGKLPSYQELFKSNKLPPLPPLPPLPKKPADFKPVVEQPKEPGKVVFVNKPNEKPIPQPPQLSKKPVAEFVKKDNVKNPMDYDKMFGDGIV